MQLCTRIDDFSHHVSQIISRVLVMDTDIAPFQHDQTGMRGKSKATSKYWDDSLEIEACCLPGSPADDKTADIPGLDNARAGSTYSKCSVKRVRQAAMSEPENVMVRKCLGPGAERRKSANAQQRGTTLSSSCFLGLISHNKNLYRGV